MDKTVGLRTAFNAPWRGLRFLRESRCLWPYAIPPILLNLVVSIGVLLALVAVISAFIFVVHPLFSRGSGLGSYLWLMLEIVVVAIFGILALGAAFLSWRLLSGILCGYKYGQLAEQAELLLGLPEDEITEPSFRYQVWDSARDVGLLLLIQLACLLISLIPIVGLPIGWTVGAYRTCFLFGRDYLDFPLALRGYGLTEKLQFCHERRRATIGLGASVFLLQLIPIVSAVLLTTAVLGAVLLHRDMLEHDMNEEQAEKSESTECNTPYRQQSVDS